MLLALPGDPEFEAVLDNMPPPPNWRSHEASGEVGLVQDLDSGTWIPVNQAEFIEIMMEQGDLYFPDNGES